MLADVEAVVGRVDEVSVVKQVILREVCDGTIDDIVDRLQGSYAVAVVLVVFSHFACVQLREIVNPVDTGGLRKWLSLQLFLQKCQSVIPRQD